MDLSSFKEEFINICQNAYNWLVNNPIFYFLKEKYDHLSSFYRKILQIAGCLILLCILFIILLPGFLLRGKYA